MSMKHMLTTFDNPYNPFDDFTSWFLFDVEKGYNTCSYLGRIAKVHEDMTQKEEDDEVERAINEILLLNPLNIYKKVSKEINDEQFFSGNINELDDIDKN